MYRTQVEVLLYCFCCLYKDSCKDSLYLLCLTDVPALILNDSSVQIIPKKRKHTLPLSAICSVFIYIKANHSQMILLQSIITSQIVFSHYYSKHTVICSDRAICYCSSPINLARGEMCKADRGNTLYRCNDVLISCGKINFAMIANI